MPLFFYRAKQGPEKNIEGTLEAASREDAIKKIEGMGCFPIRVEETQGPADRSEKIFLKRVSYKTITIFTRQLATLIKSGVPILRALEIIKAQAQSSYFKYVLGKLYVEIKEGQAFSKALSNYPGIFSYFYVSMVRAGEDSGAVEEVLLRIAQYRERQQEIVGKIRIALVYPAIMALIGAGTIIFMLAFVMPRLTGIFATMGQELPTPTKILIATSEYIKAYWHISLAAIALIAFVCVRQSKRKEVRKIISLLKLRAPIINTLTMRKELSRFSRTLEVLIKSGIPILKALGLTIPTLNNEIIKRDFERSHKELEDGASLGASLRKSKIFPTFMVSLIAVGEESGKLDSALAELASNYEKELEESIKVLTTLLEPVMILVMGLVVGFFVMAMLLPVFQINMMIQ